MDINGVIVKENKDIEAIKTKNASLEIKMVTVKTSKKFTPQEAKRAIKSKKCSLCSETFERNCDHKNHLESHHEKKLFFGKLFQILPLFQQQYHLSI